MQAQGENLILLGKSVLSLFVCRCCCYVVHILSIVVEYIIMYELVHTLDPEVDQS